MVLFLHYIRPGTSWCARVLAAVMFALAPSAAAVVVDTAAAERIGAGDPLAGKSMALAENCRECHSEAGVSATASVPKLAGQYAGYLMKQLQDFRSSARRHPVMNAMAEGLPDAWLADIAAYYASQEIMRGNGSGAGALALELFSVGDRTRDVLPCQSCHGETGKGKAAANDCYPAIGGQQRNYLREQLLNWRSGARRNSPNGVMNVIAARLTDAEIEALADYLSGL